MRTVSLRMKMLVPVIGLILLTGLVIAYASYHFTVKLTVDQLSSATSDSLNQTNQLFEKFFRDTEAKLLQLSKNSNIPLLTKTPDKLLQEFKRFQTTDTNILNLYLGTPDKNMYVYPLQTLPKDFDPTKRAWYEEAIKKPNQIFWTEPYQNATTKDIVLTTAKIIKDGDHIVGVIGIDLSLNSLTSWMKQMKTGTNGFTFVTDQSGKILYHPESSLIGTVKENMQNLRRSAQIDYKNEGLDKRIIAQTNATTGWVIASEIQINDFETKASDMAIPILITLLCVLAFGTWMAFTFSKRFLKPILQVSAYTDKMAKGDLTAQCNIQQKDEIGELARGFNHVSSSMKLIFSQSKTIATQVINAAITLASDAEQHSRDNGEITKTMNLMTQGTQQQSSILQNSLQAMKNWSTEMNNLTQQSEGLQKKSQEVYHLSEEKKQTMFELMDENQQFNVVTSQMNQSILSFQEQAQQITKILEFLQHITKQTNLLALNASIEAARAEGGAKGFNVVALEMKKLAAQSDDSLRSIGTIIKQIQIHTNEIVENMQNSNQFVVHQNETLETISNAFNLICTEMDQFQNAAVNMHHTFTHLTAQKDTLITGLEEITAVVKQAAAGTEQVYTQVSQQQASIQSSNELAKELRQTAYYLMDKLKKFKVE